MSERKKAAAVDPPLAGDGLLELNRETLQDLAESESEQARGGGFSGSLCGCPVAGNGFTVVTCTGTTGGSA